MFTNYGALATTWAIGSNLSNNYIQSFEVGYGSGVEAVTNVTNINGSIRVMQTGSPNFTTANKVTFQGDFTAVQMSGLVLTEFGLFTSGALNVGSTWFRSSFPSVTFDGTNEAQIITTIEVIPG